MLRGHGRRAGGSSVNGWPLGLVLTLAALVAGTVGGVFGARIFSDEHPAPSARRLTTLDDAPAEEADLANADEESEVEALRGRLASMERRISLLTAALARGQSAAEPADDSAEPSPREADVADPVFEAAVLDIMDRERERADGERETRRSELRTQRITRLSQSLKTNLDLDDGQEARVAELVTAHFDALRALRSDDNPERPVTPREWREKAAEFEQSLQKNLAQVLTPKQMAAYQALDPEDQIGMGFGRPRGRGGPPAQASGAPASPERQ
jgi:hypothetical protein